jgi:hypothetical protein
MTTATKSITASAIAVIVVTMCAVTQADARRMGGVRPRARINANRVVHNITPVHRARVAAHNIRPVGRWVNGVWLVNGVAASVAVGTASNCDYYYRKWKATGSSYWRDRYHENCG